MTLFTILVHHGGFVAARKSWVVVAKKMLPVTGLLRVEAEFFKGNVLFLSREVDIF
jgi:hypothetical protein